MNKKIYSIDIWDYINPHKPFTQYTLKDTQNLNAYNAAVANAENIAYTFKNLIY